MKNKIINLIACLLILTGICLLGYVAYTKYDTYKGQQKIRTEFNQIVKDSNDKKQSDNNKDKQKDSYSGPTPIALLKIPKVGVEVAVAEGTSDYVLKYAVGHFEETAMPGEKGNFAVAGHRNFTYAQYFKDLDKLKNGDKIIVTTKDGEFTYLVDNSFIVDPHRTEVLDKTKDATITLITCTIGAKERLIITGKLQK